MCSTYYIKALRERVRARVHEREYERASLRETESEKNGDCVHVFELI